MIKRVKVTEEHIKKGIRLKGNFCPIALALKDAGCRHATVGYDFIRGVFERKFLGITVTEHYVSTAPSPEMRNFMYTFDGGNPTSPFEFDLVIS